MEHYEKIKSTNNMNRGRRKNPGKDIENIFNVFIEENFPNQEEEVPIKVQQT